MPMMLPVLLALFLQEKIEDNSWMRNKPGTWIKSKFTMVSPEKSVEDVQTLTLKEIEGDEYVIRETYATPGSGVRHSRRSRGVKDGTETLTLNGKAYDCRITRVKGTGEDGATDTRFWTPAGSKNAVKIVFKDKEGGGELLATSVDEKVTAMGRTLLCNHLKGKVKWGETEGVLNLVLSEDIPGSQVRADLVLKSEAGTTKISFEALEMHEEK